MGTTTPPKIDLYSDTQTRPTAQMREAIANAEVGDEQAGEDPTCNALQERMADLFGTEAAMFVVSGTMSNNISIAAWTRRGDAVVVDARSHILRSETAGAVVGSSVVLDQIRGERGHFSVEQLDEVLHPGSLYAAPTTVVSMENTHNFAGGTVWPIDQYRAVAERAHEVGARVHVDGARLFNATAASGVPLRDWAEPVDSIWVDFTKGLGAPIGAVLAGSTEFIAQARRYKHVFGAAMRQAGIAAAGCLYALDHHVERLTDDHANAARLAAGLVAAGCEVVMPETNIVFFDPPADTNIDDFVSGLAAHDIRIGKVQGRLRAVTHLDITTDDIDTTIDVITSTTA